MRDDFYRTICKGRLAPVQRTIELAAKSTHVEITTLIIGTKNSSEKEIDELGRWIASIDKGIPLHLSKYFPAYKMKLPETKYQTLIRAKEATKKHLDYVYIGNVWGIDNNTYCPSCHNEVLHRHSNVEVLGIEDGRCNNCGQKLNII